MSSPFTVRPCTIADAQALATVAMCAFWTDAQWQRLWQRNGRSLEDAISAAARRNAKLLLTGRHVERHEKVLSGDGEIVGYARWILPDVHGVDHMWTEARVPDVSADAEAKAERMFEEARGDWPPFGKARPQQGANQEDPIIEARDRLLRGKDYIGERYYSILNLVQALDSLLSHLRVWIIQSIHANHGPSKFSTPSLYSPRRSAKVLVRCSCGPDSVLRSRWASTFSSTQRSMQ